MQDHAKIVRIINEIQTLSESELGILLNDLKLYTDMKGYSSIKLIRELNWDVIKSHLKYRFTPETFLEYEKHDVYALWHSLGEAIDNTLARKYTWLGLILGLWIGTGQDKQPLLEVFKKITGENPFLLKLFESIIRHEDSIEAVQSLLGYYNKVEDTNTIPREIAIGIGVQKQISETPRLDIQSQIDATVMVLYRWSANDVNFNIYEDIPPRIALTDNRLAKLAYGHLKNQFH